MAGFFIGKCGAFDFYKIRTSNDNEMVKIGEEGHIEAEIFLLVFVYILRNRILDLIEFCFVID